MPHKDDPKLEGVYAASESVAVDPGLEQPISCLSAAEFNITIEQVCGADSDLYSLLFTEGSHVLLGRALGVALRDGRGRLVGLSFSGTTDGSPYKGELLIRKVKCSTFAVARLAGGVSSPLNATGNAVAALQLKRVLLAKP